MREYDLIAEWYSFDRKGPTGIPEARLLASSIANGSLVLDVGCGSGIPLTRVLLEGGHRVVGLDSSPEMLRRFRTNCPKSAAILGVVQSCPFPDCTFAAVHAWGVIFHLNREEQPKAIASVSRVLTHGGLFLFTSADVDPDPDEGITGTMNGVTFPYFSFSSATYRRLLARSGLALVDVHVDAGQNTYYLARKTA